MVTAFLGCDPLVATAASACSDTVLAKFGESSLGISQIGVGIVPQVGTTAAEKDLVVVVIAVLKITDMVASCIKKRERHKKPMAGRIPSGTNERAGFVPFVCGVPLGDKQAWHNTANAEGSSAEVPGHSL